jgi:hypothetical protein
MSRELFYIQCRLEQIIDSDSFSYRTAWIPERYARKGRVLRIKQGDVWADGWEVTETYVKKPARVVEATERDYLKQRSVSDV